MFIIFLWVGIIWDIFQMSGNIPQSQFLNKIDKGSVTTESQIFSILIEISSWPCALFTFKFLILRKSSLLNLIIVNLLSVIKCLQEGKTLLLEIVVHWEEKNIERLVFSVKSDIILLFTNRGGIKGTL